MIPTQRELFRLFVPLALSGIFFPLARPIINAALARSANPELALAAFAVALSVTMPLMSPLFGLRQVATALSSDKDMLARIRTLTVALGSVSTVLLLCLCLPPIYDFIVIQSMAIPPNVAEIGAPVLFIFALSPLLSVGRGYYQGILVHYQKAGPIGTGALFYVLGIGATIIVGNLFWGPEGALLAAIASVVGQAIYLAIVAFPSLRIIRAKIPEQTVDIPDHHRNYRYLALFYFPLAVSTILSALAEPALQTGMARSPAPTLSLAAYAVATSLGWLARTPLWNAQQIVISQATTPASYAETQKFMLRLGTFCITVVALLSAPYISDVVFSDLMGVHGEVKQFAISGFRWMLPLIFLQTLRSLYHGVLIRQGLTKHIQYASMLKLPTVILALTLGITYSETTGLYVAIGANTLAETVEIYWLYRAQKNIQWTTTQTP